MVSLTCKNLVLEYYFIFRIFAYQFNSIPLILYQLYLNFPRDEKVVSRAIELNDQLQKVLARHDALLAARSTSTANHFNLEETEEEEEAEQLFRRYVHLN